MGVLRVKENGAWKDVYPAMTNPTPGNVYADAAARDAAMPSPTEGQKSYLLDLHQEQLFTTAYGWLPSNGVLPYGSIATGATQQSCAANVDTKLVFTGATPQLYGGMTWNSSENRFISPAPGLFEIRLTLQIRSNATASSFHGACGTATTPGQNLFGETLPASTPTFIATGSVNASEARLAAWVTSTIARSNIDYVTLIARYIGFPVY